MLNVFELVATLTLDASEYIKSLNNAEGKTESLGSKISSGVSKAAKVGAAAFAATSAAVVAFGKKSVDVGAEFDKSMSQVAATMGYSAEQLNDSTSEASQNFVKLRDFAQEMGSKTAFTASQAADALNYMALAGYDAETSISMLPNVLNLAAAGNMELATASDMITDTQSALGLSIDETTELVDKMAKASSKSNTSVEQLGSAMLTIGGTAKSLKGGTTELATALGILADNGVKGSEGGTALRNILTSIQGKKFEKTFGKMGISAYDAQGNLRSLKDVFLDMEKAMDGMNTQKRTAIINKTFNARDLKNVNALLATTASRWDELGAAVDDSASAAKNMADTQLDNLAGDVTIFKSALDGVYITLSDKLSPMFRRFVQSATKGLEQVTKKLSDYFESEEGEEKMERIYDAISRVIDVIIDNIDPILDLAVTLINGIASAIEFLVTHIDLVIGALQGIAGAFVVIKGFKIVKTIGDVAGLVKNLASHVGNVVTNMNNAATASGTLSSASGPLLSVLGKVATAALAVGDALLVAYDVQALTDAASTYAEANDTYLREIDNALANYKKLYDEKGKEIADQWANMVYQIDTTNLSMEESQKAIAAKIETYWDGVPKNMWEGFQGGWNHYFGEGGSGLFALMGDAFSGAVNGIRGMLGISSPSKVFAEIGRYVDEGFAEGVVNNLDTVDDAVDELADAMYNDNLYQDQELQTVSATVIGDRNGGGVAQTTGDGTEQDITLVLELDGEVLARKMFRHNRNESNRRGNSFVVA